ncbi:MAG: hypothetical protein ABF379_04030 [Akkermansiaceae bacterium]
MKHLPLLYIIGCLATVATALYLRIENTRLQDEVTDLKKNSPQSSSTNHRTTSRSTTEASPRSSQDSASSFEDLLSIEDPASRIASLLEHAEGLRSSEIPQALEDIRQSSPHWDPEAKMIAHILLTRWAIDDPEGALASLEGIDLGKFGADPISVLSGVSSVNPDIAISWLDNPDNKMVKLPFMGQILAGSIAKEWVRQDSDAALKWAESLPDSQKAGAFSGVLGSLASTDPRKAASLASDLAPGGSREHIIGEIAQSWARTSPQEALDWATTLTGKERERALASGIEELAKADRQSAAQFVEALDSKEQANYLKSVSSSWANEEPAEAAEWVMDLASEFESNDAVGSALGDVLWKWTKQDPQAAGTWLNEQEKGPTLDGAITGLAGAAFEQDPEASLSWATQISNEGLRGISITVGLGAWMQRDAEAAKQWAGANNIPVPGQKDAE